MRVVAFDTTSRGCSVAMWVDGQRQLTLHEGIERGHSQKLPLMFEEVMRSFPLNDVDLILTNVGPGSFTGIRVGLAFGYGVAQGSSVPFVGGNSFDIWLASAHEHVTGDYAVILDAKRRDVYVKLSSGSHAQSMTPEQVREKIDHSPHILIGDGVDQVLPSLSSHHKVVSPMYVGADAVAAAYFKSPDLFFHAEPFYLRSADVSQPRSA